MAVCNAHDLGAFAAFGLPNQRRPFFWPEPKARPQAFFQIQPAGFCEMPGQFEQHPLGLEQVKRTIIKEFLNKIPFFTEIVL